MKQLFMTLLIVLGLCGPAMAAPKKHHHKGTWRVSRGAGKTVRAIARPVVRHF